MACNRHNTPPWAPDNYLHDHPWLAVSAVCNQIRYQVSGCQRYLLNPQAASLTHSLNFLKLGLPNEDYV